jgi:hypothetical protein
LLKTKTATMSATLTKTALNKDDEKDVDDKRLNVHLGKVMLIVRPILLLAPKAAFAADRGCQFGGDYQNSSWVAMHPSQILEPSTWRGG